MSRSPHWRGKSASRFVRALATERQTTQAAVIRWLEHAFAIIADHTWQHGEVELPGLGRFRVKKCNARQVRTPGRPDLVRIAPCEVVVFRASTNWRRK